jgi:nucleoside-diphosphate-sugar epimerase
MFAARGYEVVALAHGAPGRAHPGVRWIQADLMDAAAMQRLIDAERPDGLVHAAWRGVHGDVMSSPENWPFVGASAALVAAFAAAGGKRAAVIGSCAEYDWSDGICRAGVTPLTGQSLYGAAKNALRAQFAQISLNTGLSWVWPRPFFLYGPGEHPSRLVATVVAALLEGRPAALSHGAQVRDYCYIGDVAEGVLTAFESAEQGAIDLASGEAVSVRRIAEEIAAQIGRPELLQFGARPAPAAEAPLVLGDAGPAFDRLGWRVRTSLHEGIARTIEAARLARNVR